MKGCTVGVVDERSEIGGCYLGVAQNHLGSRTDILDCCPKAEGMIMLIRSMSPRVLAVDEIGAQEEIRAVEYAMQCGCCLLYTSEMGLSDDYTVSSSDLTSYEESLEPLQHLSEYAGYFLMVCLLYTSRCV